MNYIEQFKQVELIEATNKAEEALQLRDIFLKKYPKEKIKDLSLSDYLISKEGGLGKPDSFCRMLRYYLQPLCSMGNVRFDVFGIYYQEGDKITLSKTFEIMFGNNIEAAFKHIKEEIVRLIDAGFNKDIDYINNSKLNSSFRYKILSVYCTDEIIPVCSRGTLEGYCKALSIPFDKRMSMIEACYEIAKWKDNNVSVKDWNNVLLMFFADWLWRGNKTIAPFSISNDAIFNGMKKIKTKVEAQLIGKEVAHNKFGSGKIALIDPSGIGITFAEDKKIISYAAFGKMIICRDANIERYIEWLASVKDKDEKRFKEILNEKAD